MKASSIIATLMLGSLLACGSVKAGEGIGVDVDAGPPPPSLTGTWLVESGGLVRTISELGGQELTHVEFVATEGNPSGVATIYTEDQIGIKGCEDILFTPLGDGAISLSISSFGLVRLRLIEFEDEDTVVFTDENDEVTRMTRSAAGVPAEAECQTLSIDETYTLEGVQMETRSGLVYDGSVLHFEDRGDNYQVFNPASELFLTPIPIPNGVGQYGHIGAFQAGEFWASCGCGNNQDVRRASIVSGTITYTVDTDINFGTPSGMSAIGFGDNRLLMVAYNYTSGEETIFEVNVTAAVPVLTNTYILSSGSIRAVSFRGTELWLLVSLNSGGQALVQYDRATGRALETVAIPNDNQYHGLAFVGSAAYLAGSNEGGSAVIVRQDSL